MLANTFVTLVANAVVLSQPGRKSTGRDVSRVMEQLFQRKRLPNFHLSCALEKALVGFAM